MERRALKHDKAADQHQTTGSRMRFVFRPTGAEKNLTLPTRAALAMQGAHSITPITAESHPELSRMLDAVCERGNMLTPKAYVWHSSKPVANAVAISGGAPTVAFSESILGLLNNEELTAVAAHEMGHVKNMNHAGKLSVIAGIGGAAVSWVATRPLMGAARQQMARDITKGKSTSPAAQTMLFAKDFAIFTGALAGTGLASRSEEYAADRYGAMMMEGDGVPLMSGLQKLGEYNEQHTRPTLLGKVLKPINRLTRSHPDYDERRQALGVSPEAVAGYRTLHDMQNAPQQRRVETASEKASSPAKGDEQPESTQWRERVTEASERAATSHAR